MTFGRHPAIVATRRNAAAPNARPKHFQDVATLVTEEAVAETIICGADVDRHVEGIEKYAEAGYDHVCIHQIGPDQEGFLKFYERDVLPRLRKVSAAA